MDAVRFPDNTEQELSRLIQMAELQLVNPDQYRGQFVMNDEQWHLLMFLAHERVNGR